LLPSYGERPQPTIPGFWTALKGTSLICGKHLSVNLSHDYAGQGRSQKMKGNIRVMESKPQIKMNEINWLKKSNTQLKMKIRPP
jgi:hypothetical protein